MRARLSLRANDMTYPKKKNPRQGEHCCVRRLPDRRVITSDNFVQLFFNTGKTLNWLKTVMELV
jgi:hypothetical protein